MAVEDILDPREDLLIAHVTPAESRRIRERRIDPVLGGMILDTAVRLEVVAVADKCVGQRDDGLVVLLAARVVDRRRGAAALK
jgi:hypothetical protein